MSKHDLTAGRLREALTYDAQTGIFLRNINSRRRPSTKVKAGTTTVFGYIAIYLDGHTYTAHRLAWLYVYGEWPKGEIDHINGDRTNNSINNLRDVLRTINSQNRRCSHASKSTGLPLGVTFKRPSLAKPYCAAIHKNGKKIHLGYFSNIQDAHEAYLNEKRKIHEGCTI